MNFLLLSALFGAATACSPINPDGLWSSWSSPTRWTSWGNSNNNRWTSWGNSNNRWTSWRSPSRSWTSWRKPSSSRWTSWRNPSSSRWTSWRNPRRGLSSRLNPSWRDIDDLFDGRVRLRQSKVNAGNTWRNSANDDGRVPLVRERENQPWTSSRSSNSRRNTDNRRHSSQRNTKGASCGGRFDGQRVPLYRLYNPKIVDHMYTTSELEKNRSALAGYKVERTAGYLAFAPGSCSCLQKFLRLFHPDSKNHLYTTDFKEASDAIRTGYRFQASDSRGRRGGTSESFEGYCSPHSGGCGATLPLYRGYSFMGQDHFYTTLLSDLKAAQRKGYKDEGVECYIWDSNF